VQEEQSLVRLAQKGDKDAFAQLYEAYFDKIYRYVVIKIGNRTEAEDMTQQVFLRRTSLSVPTNGRAYASLPGCSVSPITR